MREGLVVEKNLGIWIELARGPCIAIDTTPGRKRDPLIAVEKLRDTNGLRLLLELRTSFERAVRVMMAYIVS